VHFIHTPAAVARYASQIGGTPWTVSAHAKDIWTSEAWDLTDKLNEARWAVTCTRAGYERLSSLSDKANVHLSYHGLDLDRFPPFLQDRAPRDGSGAADPIRLVSVGRAVKKKGYDVLLSALARLPADIAWNFTHIGGGDELKTLKAQAEELGIAGRITWKGALDQREVLEHYRTSDLFALACRITADGDRDGLPNVLVEASSQALPIVSTDISGIGELFRHEENGLLVSPDNIDALAAALEKAIRNPAFRRKLGKTAEQKVRTQFDYHSSIADLQRLFTQSFAEHDAETQHD
jgi:glycosyltransferase involved in cell wall biosynthesis